MKFLVVIDNRFGEFSVAVFAAANGLHLNKLGNYSGWVDKETLERIEQSGYTYKVLY